MIMIMIMISTKIMLIYRRRGPLEGISRSRDLEISRARRVMWQDGRRCRVWRICAWECAWVARLFAIVLREKGRLYSFANLIHFRYHFGRGGIVWWCYRLRMSSDIWRYRWGGGGGGGGLYSWKSRGIRSTRNTRNTDPFKPRTDESLVHLAPCHPYLQQRCSSFIYLSRCSELRKCCRAGRSPLSAENEKEEDEAVFNRE